MIKTDNVKLMRSSESCSTLAKMELDIASSAYKVSEHDILHLALFLHKSGTVACFARKWSVPFSYCQIKSNQALFSRNTGNNNKKLLRQLDCVWDPYYIGNSLVAQHPASVTAVSDKSSNYDWLPEIRYLSRFLRHSTVRS